MLTLRHVLLTFSLSLFAYANGHASAQEAPPFAFQIYGRIGGVQSMPSNTNGATTWVDINNGHASYQAVQLQRQVTGPLVSFQMECVYRKADGSYKGQSTDDWCPDDPQGQYLQAFSLSLTGVTAQNRYHLRYQCWVGYYGQNYLKYYGPFDGGSGNLCGDYSLAQEWISRIYVWICPADNLTCDQPSP